MAVAPLFATDMNDLKARLRLSGASASDAKAQIDNATQEARLLLYAELGGALVTLILATAYKDNPVTAEERRRVRAVTVEVLAVRARLIRIMPTIFLDGGTNPIERWNDEAAFRQGTPDIAGADAALSEALEQLKAGEGAVETRGGRALAYEPDELPDLPGATVFPDLRRASA